MGKVIIAIVKGGLGNQLFIYATARALAIRTGRDLYLDSKRGYNADTYGRSYRLDRFSIQAMIMPEAWRVAPHLKHPWHKLVRALNKLLPREIRSYYAENTHELASQLTQLHPSCDRITLLGYWQHEDYFLDHATAIRAELAPPVPVDTRNRDLGRRLAESASVFVHFRRVRYAHLLGRNYYQQAINRAREELGPVNFILFGDDLVWPRANLSFGDSPVEVVEHNGGDELADLWLMTCCRHAIIANSSFSWWGAWLGDTKDRSLRRVFAPAETGLPLAMPGHWTKI
ncbi:MAG: alpha-1,2-fucosyltransferase [Verrucomicrobia bacterium]|nr:alpha-1,2-fucosyltransferase [Verrucomicrobiota bacterium]